MVSTLATPTRSPLCRAANAGGFETAKILVLEEVVDPFFFHQPAGKSEVRFAILHAVVARIVRPGQLILNRHSDEHRAQDIGHRDLMKNAAAHLLRQQPELRNNLGTEVQERLVAAPLTELLDDAIEVSDTPFRSRIVTVTFSPRMRSKRISVPGCPSRSTSKWNNCEIAS